MDPYKFNELCEQLLVTTLKEGVGRQTANLKKQKGRHKTESLRLAARPRYEPCRDCLEIIPSRTINIHMEGFGTTRNQWYKSCGHCGKKTAISSLKDLDLNK